MIGAELAASPDPDGEAMPSDTSRRAAPHFRSSRFTALLAGRFYEMNTMDKQSLVERAAISRRQQEASRRATLEAKWSREMAQLAELAQKKRQLEMLKERRWRRQCQREARWLQMVAASIIQVHVRAWLPQAKARRVLTIQVAWRKCLRRRRFRRFVEGLRSLRALLLRYRQRLHWLRQRRYAAATRQAASLVAAATIANAVSRTVALSAACRRVQRRVRGIWAKRQARLLRARRARSIKAVISLQSQLRRRRAWRMLLALRRQRMSLILKQLEAAREEEQEHLRRLAELAERRRGEPRDCRPRMERMSLTPEQRRRVAQLMRSYRARHSETFHFREEQFLKHREDQILRMHEDCMARERHAAIGNALDLLMEAGLGFTENELELMRECRRLGRGVLGLTSQADDDVLLREVMRVVYDLDERMKQCKAKHEERVEQWREERNLRRQRLAHKKRIQTLIELNRRQKVDEETAERAQRKSQWLQEHLVMQKALAQKAARIRARRATWEQERRWEAELQKAEHDAQRRQMLGFLQQRQAEEISELISLGLARRRAREAKQDEHNRRVEEQRRMRREEALTRSRQRCQQFLKEWRERHSQVLAGEEATKASSTTAQDDQNASRFAAGAGATAATAIKRSSFSQSALGVPRPTRQKKKKPNARTRKRRPTTAAILQPDGDLDGDLCSSSLLSQAKATKDSDTQTEASWASAYSTGNGTSPAPHSCLSGPEISSSPIGCTTSPSSLVNASEYQQSDPKIPDHSQREGVVDTLLPNPYETLKYFSKAKNGSCSEGNNVATPKDLDLAEAGDMVGNLDANAGADEVRDGVVPEGQTDTARMFFEKESDSMTIPYLSQEANRAVLAAVDSALSGRGAPSWREQDGGRSTRRTGRQFPNMRPDPFMKRPQLPRMLKAFSGATTRGADTRVRTKAKATKAESTQRKPEPPRQQLSVPRREQAAREVSKRAKPRPRRHSWDPGSHSVKRYRTRPDRRTGEFSDAQLIQMVCGDYSPTEQEESSAQDNSSSDNAQFMNELSWNAMSELDAQMMASAVQL